MIILKPKTNTRCFSVEKTYEVKLHKIGCDIIDDNCNTHGLSSQYIARNFDIIDTSEDKTNVCYEIYRDDDVIEQHVLKDNAIDAYKRLTKSSAKKAATRNLRPSERYSLVECRELDVQLRDGLINI